MISTVLPPPAPPNMAALPPSDSGASRSMTLIPVSKTEVDDRWSARRGAAGGIGPHGPDLVFVEVALSFDDQRLGSIPFDHQRLLDPRQCAGFERNVDDRAVDGDDNTGKRI